MNGPELLLPLAAGGALALLARTALRLRRRARLLKLTESVTRSHARVLLVKQKQLVIHDGYGNKHIEDWVRHANYFIDNVILRDAKAAALHVGNLDAGSPLRAAVTARFLSVLNGYADEGSERVPDQDIISGRHYETLCLNILQAHGWIVSTTPVTGDQGADLIADLAGKRVVIQCKFHAKPVGNKAVQEAYAAKGFHGADHAAVVSNNSFTRAARQLAQANDVLLLHHDELPELQARLPA
jgi:restriction system protein